MPAQSLSSKLPKVGTTIFTVMSALAAEHNAINLSQGFPGFSIDMKLADLVHRYMQDGFNQYAPMPGILALRESIAERKSTQPIRIPAEPGYQHHHYGGRNPGHLYSDLVTYPCRR
jgi:aspartate/methionine/tyrosine aminotransferase